MKFELTPEQVKQVDEWYESLVPKILELQKISLGNEYSVLTTNGKYPYYGAIGGGITYQFIPTGLGNICVVREAITQEELNITDFDSWRAANAPTASVAAKTPTAATPGVVVRPRAFKVRPSRHRQAKA